MSTHPPTERAVAASFLKQLTACSSQPAARARCWGNREDLDLTTRTPTGFAAGCKLFAASYFSDSTNGIDSVMAHRR